MQSLLIAIIGILCESAIYLLLGFALAGALHVVLRRTPRFAELLARKGSRSVALAALLGAPIPLCSCGVVPAAMTLRKRGASKGATVSFQPDKAFSSGTGLGTRPWSRRRRSRRPPPYGSRR